MARRRAPYRYYPYVLPMFNFDDPSWAAACRHMCPHERLSFAGCDVQPVTTPAHERSGRPGRQVPAHSQHTQSPGGAHSLYLRISDSSGAHTVRHIHHLSKVGVTPATAPPPSLPGEGVSGLIPGSHGGYTMPSPSCIQWDRVGACKQPASQCYPLRLKSLV